MNRELLKAVGLWSVSKIAPKTSLHGLVELLGSEKNDAAEAAYMALVQLGPKVAQDLVAELAEGNQSVNVLRVIGDLGDPNLIPSLEPYLNSTDADIAAAAADSIGMLRGIAGDDALPDRKG